MLCSWDTSHMVSAGHHVCCHSSTGEGSNPSKACSLTIFCVHTYACVHGYVWHDFACETFACDWEKNKRQFKWCWTWKRKRTAVVSEVCCCSVPVCLCGKCFFGGISGNRARWRERQTPCGLENMSGPEPTWAKIVDTVILCCSFSICLPVFSFVCLFQSIISGRSTSLFFVRHSFFSICCPLFFPPFPLFAVSAPPVSHYFNPIYKVHAYTMSLYPCLLFFFSISSVSFINVFSKIHMKVNKLSEMRCYKQFNQESEVRKSIDRFIFSLWAV